MRDKRSDLTKSLSTFVENKNMQNTTIEISDGKLKFVNTKVQEPLTFKYLEKSLHEVIKNENQVKQILEYLKKNRETKVVQDIKRI